MNVKKSTIIYIAIEILFQILSLIVIQVKNNSYITLAIMLIVSIICTAVTILLGYLFRDRNTENNDFKEYLEQFKPKTNVLIYILAIIACLSLLPLSSTLQGIVNSILEKTGAYKTSSTVDGIFNVESINEPGYQVLMILTVAIFIPIREELAFRSFLTRGFRDFGTLTAIILGSLAFGFVHGGLDQFFPQVLLALLIGLIYFKTENIYIPMLMHISNNMIATLLSLYGEKFIKNTSSSLSAYSMFGICFAACIILALSIFLIHHISIKSNKKLKENYLISKDKFLWNKNQYERFKNKKDIYSYIAISSIMIISFIMWIVATLSKISK